MDINNYSYTPHMLDEDNNILYYDNDDMYCEVSKERSYSDFIFWVYACSYDGQLEYSARFTDEETAKVAFDYIVNNYADTPPDDKEILICEVQSVIAHFETERANR